MSALTPTKAVIVSQSPSFTIRTYRVGRDAIAAGQLISLLPTGLGNTYIVYPGTERNFVGFSHKAVAPRKMTSFILYKDPKVPWAPYATGVLDLGCTTRQGEIYVVSGTSIVPFSERNTTQSWHQNIFGVGWSNNRVLFNPGQWLRWQA